MNSTANSVRSDCGGRQGKGQTPPKKWGNSGFTQMQGLTASEIVSFFPGPRAALCLGLLELGGSLLFGLRSSRAGFLGTSGCGSPACSWLMAEEGMGRPPIPQRSHHAQRLANVKEKSYFLSRQTVIKRGTFLLTSSSSSSAWTLI